MRLKIKKILNSLGYDINKYPSLEKRRLMKILELNDINKVIDVGANVGQYGKNLRRLGYKGVIKSFEPVTNSYNKLYKSTISDKNWDCYKIALGNNDSVSVINISGQSPSSSILKMNKLMVSTDTSLKYMESEKIEVKKLDSILYKEINFALHDNLFIKIDTQGYEQQVLEGATISLDYIRGIQIEMSLVELYEGEALINSLIEYMYNKGFVLQGLENGFYNINTLQLYQVDGIFIKSI